MLEGSIIGERYRVERIIAETELGILAHARHVQLDDAVVVKVLPEHVNDKRLAAKFVREARNAARVKSEYVARFIDVGSLEDGRPYVVMEHLEGETLDRVLARREAIGVSDAVDWTIEACDALAMAHAVGIVHREISPENLVLAVTPTRHRRLKIVGFGTSRVIDSSGREEDIGLTVAALRSSNPAYTAPEVFLRPSIDGRADLWAIGAVLYEMLSGTSPFAGPPEDLVKRILVATPPPLHEARPSITAGLSEVVQKCLAKLPDERFPDAAAVAAALAPFASPAGQVIANRIAGRTRTLPVGPLPLLRDPAEEGDREASLHRFNGHSFEEVRLDAKPAGTASVAPRAQPRRSVAAPILALLAVVTAIAAGLTWVRMQREQRESPPTSSVAPIVPSATAPAEPAPATAEPSRAASSGAPSASDVDTPSTPTAVATQPAVATPPPGAARARRPAGVPGPPTSPAAPPQSADPWGWKR